MSKRAIKPKRQREIRADGKIRSTIYWEQAILGYAKKLAAREHRSVNAWVRITVERLWVDSCRKDTMA